MGTVGLLVFNFIEFMDLRRRFFINFKIKVHEDT